MHLGHVETCYKGGLERSALDRQLRLCTNYPPWYPQIHLTPLLPEFRIGVVASS